MNKLIGDSYVDSNSLQPVSCGAPLLRCATDSDTYCPSEMFERCSFEISCVCTTGVNGHPVVPSLGILFISVDSGRLSAVRSGTVLSSVCMYRYLKRSGS